MKVAYSTYYNNFLFGEEKQYLTNNISHCNLQIIEGADHTYTNKYVKLEKLLVKIYKEK